MKFIKNFFSSSCNSCKCGIQTRIDFKILNKYPLVKKFDYFILHSIFAIPLFFLILFLVFELTFNLGGYLAGLMDNFGTYLLEKIGIQNIFFIAIWGGILGLLVYLPNVVILYFFLYFLNDSGILQAFSKRFDKYLNKIGISGKGFLSMFLGFGCTVPAIMSTKMIEDKKEQIIVVMSLPFISCSAKLPVFVLLISAFIPLKYQSLTLMGLYIFGILIAILAALFFSKILKYNNCSLKYELIIYKIPSLKNIFNKIVCVLGEFVKKVGYFIIPLSVVLTLLFYYPSGNIKSSYGYKIFQPIHGFFQPIGFNDKMSISLFPGLIGKEMIVSTLGSLYYIDDTSDTKSLIEKLESDSTISFASAISFIVFILLYTACIGSVLTAWSYLGRFRGIVFFVYPIFVAYLVSFIVYHLIDYLL